MVKMYVNDVTYYETNFDNSTLTIELEQYKLLEYFLIICIRIKQKHEIRNILA